MGIEAGNLGNTAVQLDTNGYIADLIENERTLCTEIRPPLGFADRL